MMSPARRPGTAGRRTDAWLARGPGRLALRGWRDDRLAVLAYHGVDDADAFDRHLSWLQGNASVVSLEQLIDGMRGDRLPPRPVLLTFDDGHRSVLEQAQPRLAARGMPAVVFVVAGVVDSNDPFWWQEVESLSARGGSVGQWPGRRGRELVRTLKALPDADRRMALVELRASVTGVRATHPQLSADDLRTLEAAGIAVGNHTMTHPNLNRCDDDVLVSEIETAHHRLTDILGHPPIAFADPYGSHDRRADAVLDRLGYEIGFLFDHRRVHLPLADPLAVSRVRVDSDTALDRFVSIVTGVHPAIHHWRGRP